MQFDIGDDWRREPAWSDCIGVQRSAAKAAAQRAAYLPAYREEWASAGFDADTVAECAWEALPLLSKDRLIEAAIRRPPFGDRLGAASEQLAHVFVAPGPLYMPFTRDDMRYVARSFAKAFHACGLRSDDIVDQTTMYNWVIAATAIDQALQMVGCCVVPGGVGQSERHLESARQLGVTAIVAFPTFLESLLQMAEAQGQSLPVRKAVVMGELSRPSAKEDIRGKYGISVREFYGVADVGAVAWECEAADGMHLRDDLLVEFVAPGGGALQTPSAEAPAELVVTDFHRAAMPIVRLRTGDLIDELIDAPCACGRASPRFRRIVGRASEITKVKGMFVVPRQAQDVLLRNGVDSRFRLVVDRQEGGRDALTLEIEGDGHDRVDAIREQVEAALRLRVELVFVESLPEHGPKLLDRRHEKQDA